MRSQANVLIAATREHRFVLIPVFLGVLPILVLPVISTNDGPVHVSMALQYMRCLFEADGLWNEYFDANLAVPPNQTVYWLLAAFLSFSDPIVAEAALQALTVALVPLSLFVLMRAAKTPPNWTIVLGVLLAYSQMFQLGLYNFTLSISIIVFTLSWYVSRVLVAAKHCWTVLCVLLLLLYFTHFVGFGVAAISLGLLHVASFFYDRDLSPKNTSTLLKHCLPLVLCVLPIVVLFLGFAYATMAGDLPGRPASAPAINALAATPSSPGDARPLVNAIDAPSASDRGSFASRLSAYVNILTLFVVNGWMADSLKLLLIAMFLLIFLETTAIYASILRSSVRIAIAEPSRAVFLVLFSLTIVFALAGVLGPDQFGGGWGHRRRFLLVASVFLIACFGMVWSFVWNKRLHLALMVLATGGVLLNLYFGQAKVAKQVAEFLRVEEALPKEAVVLPIIYSMRGVDGDGKPFVTSIEPFYHIASRLEPTAGRVSLVNFLARLEVYPIRFNEELDPYVWLFTDWAGSAMGRTEYSVIDLLGYEEQAKDCVDYLIEFGDPAHSSEQLKNTTRQLVRDHFAPTWRSSSGLVRLYQRRGCRYAGA